MMGDGGECEMSEGLEVRALELWSCPCHTALTSLHNHVFYAGQKARDIGASPGAPRTETEIKERRS